MNEQPVETTLYSLAKSPPKTRERRSAERHLSLLRVGAVVIGSRRELCLIRNLSAGGMMIRTYSSIAPGTRLAIELKHGDPVEGIVQWVEDGLTGVAFDAPIDIVGLLAPGSGGPRPRLPRIEVGCTAWVRDGANVVRVTAANISQGGLCIETRADLAIGGDVVVTLPGLAPTPGIVKWGSDGTFGIAFNRAMALAELVAWLQEQQTEDERRSAG